jgi:hypothetical protein
MKPMPAYDETEIANLLRLLPPAPEGWAEGAKELPRTRDELDRVLPTIERDAEVRAEVTRDLQDALEREDEDGDEETRRTREDFEPVGRLMTSAPDWREPKEDEMESEHDEKRPSGVEEDVEGHSHESEKRPGGHEEEKRPGGKRPGGLDEDIDDDDDVEGHMQESEKRPGGKRPGGKRPGGLDEDFDDDEDE